MFDPNEKFTDNSKFNRCVACKGCKFVAKTYKDGSSIPADEESYKFGFCEKYDFLKPDGVELDEADCPSREEDK